MLRSEIVKAWVCPACTTWPGGTRRSTTSPLIGASTGICADDGAFARSGGILDPENLHPLFGRIQIRLGLGAVRLSLLKIAFGDGMVLIQVLRANVEFCSARRKASAAFK